MWQRYVEVAELDLLEEHVRSEVENIEGSVDSAGYLLVKERYSWYFVSRRAFEGYKGFETLEP